MSDTDNNLPDWPTEVGNELAAIFGQRESRTFDPNAPRGDVGGTPPGGPVPDPVAPAAPIGARAAMGQERDSDLVPPGGWPGGDTADATQQLAGSAAPAPAAEPDSGDGTETDGRTVPATGAPAAGELPAPTGLPAPTVTPQVTAPAVDGQSGGGTVANGSTSPPVEPFATSDGWVYNYDNNGAPASIKFTNEQVEEGLGLVAWANDLSPQIKAAMTAVEEGQAVAIARADYDRFQAWQNEQQRTTRDRDLDQYDEDAAKEIQRLRDELAQTLGQPQQLQQPVLPVPPQGYNQNVDTNLTNAAQAYDRGAREWAEAHNLTEQERSDLLDVVIAAEIIPGLTRQYTQFNPVTGKPVRPADPALVITKALDAALSWNPALHTASISRQPGNQPTTQPTNQPTTQLPSSELTVDPVTTKRAKAASLASAPSAAVPPTPRNTNLTGQEAVNAMAAELLEFMNR